MGAEDRIKKISKTKMAILIALLIAAFFSILNWLQFGVTYENKMLDFRFNLRKTVGPSLQDEIVVVAIDDQTLSKVKERWPWPRSVYAKAIDNLSRARAHVVALDLIFSEPSHKELLRQDRILGDAIIRSRSWIVLASKFYTQKRLSTDGQNGMEILHVDENRDKEEYVTSIPDIDPEKTHVGYVNIWYDRDGIIRNAALLHKNKGKIYESFALKILSRFHKLKDPGISWQEDLLTYGPFKIKVQRNVSLLINFRGGPQNFQTISFDAIMDAEIFQGLLESGIFKGKIVLIGPTFTEAQDMHHIPCGVMSGVEIHANVLDTIMQGKYLKVVSGWVKVCIFFGLALVLALICVHLRSVYNLGVLVAAILLYSGAASWLFVKFHIVVPMFIPMFMITVSTYLGVTAYLLVTEERQSRYIKGVFSRYVSPKVVEQLVKDPNAELRLGGNKQRVTVLFSDVRGFTSLSEQLAPELVVDLLNEYFQTWTEIIFRYDGMVDKFIGDAVMAIFGAPVAHKDDPIRAVRAAMDMQQALTRLQEKWQTEGKHIFNIGVGINTGEAIVGNMGSQQAMGYTVIGDTVNLASRLESKTKDLGAFLLISQSTYEEVKDKAEVREHPGIMVKGKTEVMFVYEVLRLKA